MEPSSFQALGISLMVGLLVGLQREWRDSGVAGIRTFPLITMLGTILALTNNSSTPLLLGAGLVAVTALLGLANVGKLAEGETDLGMTTEAAALLMYGVGAALGFGLTAPAIVTAGVAAVLLHWKKYLHTLADQIGEKDFKAIIHLTLIGLIILPLLPDQTYDSYEVLNPFKIWLMVVLIVGISLAAYVAYRILGAKNGAVIGGVLGGLISSTATTVSYSRQSKESQGNAGLFALVIMIATAIVNVRVLLEVGAVAPQLLQSAVLPFCAILLLMVVECVCLYIPLRNIEPEAPNHENPAQLKPALVFAALYAVVLFVVAAAKHHFGNQALYAAAVISGLTDVDAITLSTAQLYTYQKVEAGVAWRVIVMATMSNMVFKAGAVAMLGSRRLLLYVLVLFGIALAGSGAVLVLWPEDFAISLPDINPADSALSHAESA